VFVIDEGCGLNSKGERGRFRGWLERGILTGRHTLFLGGQARMANYLVTREEKKRCNHDRPRCKLPAHRYEINIADPRLALIN
jgi:hypothetical protein